MNSKLFSNFECELTTFNTDLFNKLTSFDQMRNEFDMIYQATCSVQVRRHKKKRINKKWAKRYGYREIPCYYRIENAHVTTDGDSVWVTSGKPIIMKGDISLD